ncbi:putative NTPase (NACHT family) [Streptomyces sp. MA5143a]|nr:putative NTPase (NACHT family) [Streptomyces sp. MA5143a]
MPAVDILAGDGSCVVVAGPGGGKSTLLRVCAAEGARLWATGLGGNSVPVLVPAAALSEGRPFADALAAAVSAALGPSALLEQLPAGFFAAPPKPGARWLVLVDALDEVVDPAARRQVLQTLAVVAEHEQLYRFVITTRPLPDGELDVVGPKVDRFNLQPFDDQDILEFTRGWFSAAGLSEPAERAAEFLKAVAAQKLMEFARVPLMAAMLCQVHVAGPGRPLPAGRSAIFRDFTELLYERQLSGEAAGIRVQARAAMTRYGADALARVESVLDQFPAAISRLAVVRMREQELKNALFMKLDADTVVRPEAAVDVIAEAVKTKKPLAVPQRVWRDFLETCLRRSGLLIAEAGDYAFVHQTLAEYLAAPSLVRRSGVLRFRVRRTPLIPFPMIPRYVYGQLGLMRRLRRNRWLSNDSFAGFVLDQAYAQHPGSTAKFWRRIVRHGRHGCLFVFLHVQLGTDVPPPVVRMAAAKLRRYSGVDNLSAALELGDSQAADLLACIAAGTGADGEGERIRAAAALGAWGDFRGADLLNGIGVDPSIVDYVRLSAAKELVALGDHRGADVLAAIAADQSVAGHGRIRAADELAALGDVRGPDLLSNLATDITIDRLAAARRLVALGDSRVPDLLTALAGDANEEASVRLGAATALCPFDRVRGADFLADIALTTETEPQARVNAARELINQNDARGLPHLIDVAHNTLVAARTRVDAAEQLGILGDRRGTDVLTGILADTNASDAFLAVVRALGSIKDQRALPDLTRIAHDVAQEDTVRVEAAEVMAILGDLRGATLLDKLARGVIDDHSRLKAVIALLSLGDPRGSALLDELTDWETDSSDSPSGYSLRSGRYSWEDRSKMNIASRQEYERSEPAP